MRSDAFMYITNDQYYGYKLAKKEHDDENFEEMTDGEFISRYGYTEHPRIEDEEEEK